MKEQIEKLRDKLDNLINKGIDLHRGEALRVSKELDKLIYTFYENDISA